jgi:hypothetical protein
MIDMKSLHLAVAALTALTCVSHGVCAEEGVPAIEIPALTIKGQDFVDASGQPVKFWGVNLVGLYPEHSVSDALANNLDGMQVNLVRPHHNLRPSSDWNPTMTSGALLTYKGNSREFDPVALDRFDYLNAALKKKGIYLALSVNWTRRYLPDDFDIVPGDEQERAAWTEAMKELNSWPWKKAFDVYKMLPAVDERAALLNEEFLKKFLAHVNPYTGVSYAKDPQVLSFEVMNEASTEYAVICGNRLPAHWEAKLLEKWNAYAKAAGIEPGDLYKPADPKAKEVRAKFLNQIDEEYFERIKKVVRDAGSMAPMTFSNLWRGENIAAMNARTADIIEDHIYMDPQVVKKPEDGFYNLSRSALTGKPFFVGELNQAEGENNIREQSPFRSMLPIATSAYASLQDWSGMVWFSWLHGGQMLGPDGWAKTEGRASNLGQMISDGMMLDHIRTTGMIFRRGLVKKSTLPITLWVDEPFTQSNYEGLMRGKYSLKPGWQDVHGIRKSFGPVPEGQRTAAWMTQAPANPIVSDTGEIIKDVVRKQLTVTAPQAEAFSGYLDAEAPAGIPHLSVTGEGFVTVVLVAEDGKPLGESAHVILSRTAMDAKNVEVDGPQVTLRGLAKAPEGSTWQMKVTRPRAVEASAVKPQPLEQTPDGNIALPLSGWHECEIFLSSSKNTVP